MKKNKALKVWLAVLVLLAAGQAAAQVYYKSGTFALHKVQRLVVFPGVMGSPVTTSVTFELVMKKCSRLQIDSFWADGFADKVNISYAGGESWDGKPMKGDTLRVSLVYYRLTTQEGYPANPDIHGSVEQAAPVAHKGKALFRYRLGDGKTYYFSIKEMEDLPSIYAP